MPKLKCIKAMGLDFTEEQLLERLEVMKKGNISAFLCIIMHNQLVIAEKLNDVLRNQN